MNVFAALKFRQDAIWLKLYIKPRQCQLQSEVLKAQIYLHDFPDMSVSLSQWPYLSAILWNALKALWDNDLTEVKMFRVSSGQIAVCLPAFAQAVSGNFDK